MSTVPKLPLWDPDDRMGARWVRAMEAAIRWLAARAQPLRITVSYNSDRAPIRYPLPPGTPEPSELRLVRAVRSETGDRDLRASGYGIDWYWRGREIEVSLIDGLGSTVEYNVTLELVE